MKYGVQYGSGTYVFNGRSATVVMFGNGSACRAWVREFPSRREEIPGRCYVTNAFTQKQVSVTKAAVSPDTVEGQESDGGRIPLELDEDAYYIVSKSRGFGET